MFAIASIDESLGWAASGNWVVAMGAAVAAGLWVFFAIVPSFRFASIAEDGVTYRNRLLVRHLRWRDVELFKYRESNWGRGPWRYTVVAKPRGRRRVFLRATSRYCMWNGAFRPDVGFVIGLAFQLETIRVRMPSH
ncbi:MAG: hypothetical protein QOH79_58 [Acidimicrobiaceae bacterium]